MHWTGGIIPIPEPWLRMTGSMQWCTGHACRAAPAPTSPFATFVSSRSQSGSGSPLLCSHRTNAAPASGAASASDPLCTLFGVVGIRQRQWGEGVAAPLGQNSWLNAISSGQLINAHHVDGMERKQDCCCMPTF